MPWIDGKPDDIVNLDKEEEMSSHGIKLNTNYKKGDYYVHFLNGKWMVVERKNSYSRFEHIKDQIKDTVGQLRAQGHKVHDIIMVAEKKHPNERRVWNTIDHEVYSVISPVRKKVGIEGMVLKFYSTKEVNTLRRER